MTRLAVGLGVAAVSATLGAAVSLATMLPGVLALAGTGALVGLAVFLLWPWAVLPVGIVGGAVAGGLVGGGDVRTYVAAHLLVLAVGGIAVLIRYALGFSAGRRRTSADTGMMLVVGLTLAAACYGLAVGNLPTEVVVAAYQIAILPLYFFLATHTLTTHRRLAAAGLLYVGVVAVLAAISMTVPGRHGGLLTLLAVPMLAWFAGHYRGWRRLAAVLLAGLFAIDVVLASYRGIWLAAGVTLLTMLIFGGRAVRTGLGATATVGLVVAALLALQPGVRERAQEIGIGLQQSAGYRASESSVGLDVFADRPVLGAGLGQSTTDVYLADFALTDVGPVYHAFYVTLLANVGLVGLALVLWPVLRGIRAGLADPSGPALPFAALCCGFLGAAVFAAPSDGHWELGLLPALALLTARPAGQVRQPPPGRPRLPVRVPEAVR
ncbi:O-antigen ligase family protein [Verrucosispora sp. WMMD573]|uniref:O-antigen ligase family protein n=1 Tax=Verrucosispora sp. WMMD573 TaxID=3015149 RepID=UPI00248BBCE8|nr:O-antigen ligase family protein [Verrucosispora sp. WMMD573]WBB53685.1 O-antigen ligase family protein [Verrucosispora sp. WMMD573]